MSSPFPGSRAVTGVVTISWFQSCYWCCYHFLVPELLLVLSPFPGSRAVTGVVTICYCYNLCCYNYLVPDLFLVLLPFLVPDLLLILLLCIIAVIWSAVCTDMENLSSIMIWMRTCLWRLVKHKDQDCSSFIFMHFIAC